MSAKVHPLSFVFNLLEALFVRNTRTTVSKSSDIFNSAYMKDVSRCLFLKDDELNDRDPLLNDNHGHIL